MARTAIDALQGRAGTAIDLRAVLRFRPDFSDLRLACGSAARIEWPTDQQLGQEVAELLFDESRQPFTIAKRRGLFSHLAYESTERASARHAIHAMRNAQAAFDARRYRAAPRGILD